MTGFVGHPGRNESDFRGRANVSFAVDCDDLAGDGAVEGLHRGEVRLQEAPFGFHIISEGAALLVAEAGRLALIERHVLFAAQVEAEIVAVLRSNDRPAVCGKGGRPDRYQENQRR